VVAVHAPLDAWTGVTRAAGHRLAHCELITSSPLGMMEAFYRDRLELQSHRAPGRLTIVAGDTRITFIEDPRAAKPFYHFAFNIPENKIVAAREWQLARSPLLPIPDRNRARDLPPDIVDYSHWNAHSVFFLDPGGNVVEYIARHDLKNAASGAFTSRDILAVTEIALVVDDVAATTARLRPALAIEHYRGSSADFAALGDEEGLVLVMRRGRILNFNPSSQEKAARIYPTTVRLRGSATDSLSIDGFPYAIHKG
jgi:hypothetical protein